MEIPLSPWHLTSPFAYSQVIMTKCYFITTKAKKAVNRTFTCFKLPFRVLRSIWKAQLFLLSIPLRLIRNILRTIRRLLEFLIVGRIESNIHQLLENFIGRENADREQLLSTVRELREHSLTAIAKLNGLNTEFLRCRHEVRIWKDDNDKKVEDIANSFQADKKSLKEILNSLKNVKDSQDSIEVVVLNSREWTDLQVAQRGVDDSKEGYTPGDISSTLKIVYKRLVKQLEDMKDTVHGVDTASLVIPDDRYFLSTMKRNTKEINIVSLSVETFKTIISLLNEENISLTNQLNAVNEQLKNGQISNSVLRERVVFLEKMLRKAKKKIRAAEENRDDLTSKLTILRDLIEEQEEFLKARHHIFTMGSITHDTSLSESQYETAEDVESSDSEDSMPEDS